MTPEDRQRLQELAQNLRDLAGEYQNKRWLSGVTAAEANKIHALIAVQLILKADDLSVLVRTGGVETPTAYSREEFERDRFGQTGDDMREARGAVETPAQSYPITDDNTANKTFRVETPAQEPRQFQIDYSCMCSDPYTIGELFRTRCNVHRDGVVMRVRVLPSAPHGADTPEEKV